MIDYPICVFDPVKETILNDHQLIRFIDERCGRDVAETVQSLLPTSVNHLPTVKNLMESALSDANDMVEALESALEAINKLEE